MDRGDIAAYLIIFLIIGGPIIAIGSFCYVSYTHPFLPFTVSGKLVTIDTDWYGTSFTIQQTITANHEYNVGRYSGITVDYTMIGKDVILYYDRNGDSYIKLLQEDT